VTVWENVEWSLVNAKESMTGICGRNVTVVVVTH